MRKPTFEVKKRPNLRHSKVAQFRDASDKESDDEDEDDDDEKSKSFFTKIISKVSSYFKSKPKVIDEDISDNDDDKSDKSAEIEDERESNDENENKPLLVEIFNSFRTFLEASSRHQKQDRNAIVSSDEDDDNDDEDQESSDDEDGTIDDNDSDSTLKNAIRKTFLTIFNRIPFNLIYDFDESDNEEVGEVKTFEDSEEDEINYQKLLKEEREQEEQKTEQLMKHVVEEEVPKIIEEPANSINEEEKLEEQEEVVEDAIKPEITKESPVKQAKKSKEVGHLGHKQFEKLLLNLPSFVPDYAKVRNPECQKQGEVFQRQLRGQKLWALQMLDSTAKIPSGLLRGNVNQLGDFDLCTKISQKIKISESNTMKMRGKYCLANIDVVAAVDQLKLPVHLMQGRNFIRSSINDVRLFFH